ncbi:protein-tyrosine-phosphatase [Martiniozyma asiatica (nom. inval.)]|nr:protein-tyrosine-phosphatase [Martiniozyma asiatica]
MSSTATATATAAAFTSTTALVVPPIKHAIIHKSLYRGSQPRPLNYPYLKSLSLTTLIALTPDPPSASLIEFCNDNHLKLNHFQINKNTKNKGKNRGVPITHEQVCQILQIISTRSSGITYLFCENGGQITSLIIACLRKIELWASVSIWDEFATFAGTVNQVDRVFVENWVACFQINDKVDWLWNGLSDVVIKNHPALKNVGML